MPSAIEFANRLRRLTFAFMSTDKQYPRIIFLGTPDFAVATLKALVENKYNVVAVVTAPDKPAGRGMQLKAPAVKEYAVTQQIPVLQPEKLRSKAFLAELAGYKADLQVVVAFRMLPEVVWDMPPLGTVNVHASLLPQYRGAAPINWAIINGEKETGVTTFKLVHEIDTGNVLLQQTVAILPEDNMGTMYEKLMQAGAGLLLKTVEGLINNTITEQPQPTSDILKHAPKIFREDCRINWEMGAEAIHNLIRGMSPYPAAFTSLEGKQLKIFQSGFERAIHDKTPGTYETDAKTFLRFAAIDGWVDCKEIQFEGKKRMDIVSFLRGFRF